MSPPAARLWQLLDLVGREDRHLRGVTARLFPVDEADRLEADALGRLLATPVGIDRLESFVGKFSRMQDTMMDKLLPAFLRAAGEPTGAAIDNLNRLEAIGLLDGPADWMSFRLLRNRLIHEYVEDLEELAAALAQARQAVARLHQTFQKTLDYCQERPALARPPHDPRASQTPPL